MLASLITLHVSMSSNGVHCELSLCILDGFWKDEKNRRNFFLQFAEEEHFSPLVADNWYKMTEKISQHKVHHTRVRK